MNERDTVRLAISADRLTFHLFGKAYKGPKALIGGDKSIIKVYLPKNCQIAKSRRIKFWEGYSVTYTNL